MKYQEGQGLSVFLEVSEGVRGKSIRFCLNSCMYCMYVTKHTQNAGCYTDPAHCQALQQNSIPGR